MFLAADDIKRRIKEGSLGIEPFDENQLGGFAIDLRVGQRFRGLPADDLATAEQALRRASFAEVDFGKSLAVEPGSTVLGVSFEYVQFPGDLAGFLFPKSSVERAGLAIAAGTIDPGFHGKIAVTIRNFINRPVLLYPGQPIVRLCFAALSRPVVSQGGDRESTEETAEKDVERIKAVLKSRTTERKAEPGLAGRFTTALEADGAVKGPLLEALIEELFAGVEGLSVVKRNARLRAEEIDLIVKNNLGNGFWQIAGSPILVECKNWSGKTGAREISVLVDKLQAISPDAKTRILVAPNGITGDSTRDAILKIREARQRGRYILVFDREDLRQMVEGAPLEDVIERKYEQLLLI